MAQLNIHVDDGIMALAESACEEIGLTLSEAICIFLKRLACDRKMPFEASCPDPFWSEENQARLRKSISQLEAGEGKVHEVNYDDVPNAETVQALQDAEEGRDTYGPYDTVQDLMKSLDGE